MVMRGAVLPYLFGISPGSRLNFIGVGEKTDALEPGL
ncbi:hypothetical protein BMETH_1301110502, partial [methanotrophic bacterial endosymbiont of Bathymodiolus sp.]